jgi:hypothetical protein
MAVGTGIVVSGNWYNSDGLPVLFPQHYTDPAQRTNKPTADVSFGVYREIVIPFDLTKIGNGLTGYPTDKDNDGTTDGFTEHDAHLPADSTPLSARMFFSETAAGGTSCILGSYKIDGTIIDDDAFITATEAVTANMTKGKCIVGAGVAAVAASNVYPVLSDFNVWPALKATGTFTAGKGFIVITYVDISANPELYASN